MRTPGNMPVCPLSCSVTGLFLVHHPGFDGRRKKSKCHPINTPVTRLLERTVPKQKGGYGKERGAQDLQTSQAYSRVFRNMALASCVFCTGNLDKHLATCC